jgi:hypothetical protein
MSTSRRVLAALAVCAFLWALVRAWSQSLTIDEADTYLSHVSRPGLLWIPSANNHVLHSILMRISTRILGVSQFTLRLPALFGAAIYLWAVVRLCRLLTPRWAVQALVFTGLVFNPLVADFLAAARGYGLASAFLLLGIVYAAERIYREGHQRSLALCVIPSVCFGLSFSANFSFAFVAAASMAAVFLGAWRMRSAPLPKLLAASAVPAAAIALLITRSAIFNFPRDQLWYGAKTLRETFRTVSEASLYRVNPDWASPGVVSLLDNVQQGLLPLVLIASLLWGGFLLATRRPDWRLELSIALAGIAAAALGMHWIVHRFWGLLLPQDRTAIYLPVLLTAAAGSILAIEARSAAARLARGAQAGAVTLLGVYYLLCVRVDHFKEWRWDSETRRIYEILACLNHEQGVRDVISVWMYVSPLKAYHAASGQENFRSIIDLREATTPAPAYAINRIFDQGVIAQRNLTVIYEGPSEAAVGVTPDLAARLRPSACLRAAGVSAAP